MNSVFIKVDPKSKSFVACCAQVWRSTRSSFCEQEYLQSSFEWKTLAIRWISFLHPFDFEEPEEGFSRATRGLDRLSMARRSRGSRFPQRREYLFIKADSKSKSFVACCAQVWRNRRISFVSGSIRSAGSNGKCWRFGGVVFTPFRLNNVNWP